MRSQNFIFILVLLTINLTYTFDITSFVELGELQNDPYGKSLIETISMSMKNAPGGRIEAIETLLNDLEVKLINDQKKSDADWNKERTRLDNRIAALKLFISKLKAEIARLKKEKTEYEGKKAQSERNLKQYTAQKRADENAHRSIVLKRKSDRAAYETSVKEHSAVIGAIEQVIAALAKLRGSVAGVGRPGHVHEIGQERRDAEWRKAHAKKSLLEIVGDDDEIQAFLELATEADQAALEKLIALLNNILNNTKKSLTDDERAETASIATFKRLKANLENDMTSLSNLLKRQQGNLDSYNKKINDLTITINIRVSLKHSRQLELKNTTAERTAKLNHYNADKAHRTKEKGVIERVEKIVKERLAAMSRFLRSNVNK